uniref:Pept_C1 domain-containing protein n=1 Tax=Heligmosomoides polygyrus TaxID=6339 RepID=A0A8L8KKZ4_HELPZ
LFLLVCTEHISTIEEFLATPIPKEAHELTGQALVDYVNQRQPFFEASLSPLSKQERQWRLMKLKYLEKPDELRKKHMQNEAASLDLNTTDLPERCEGGYPIAAWKYIINEGVCSGGRYGEKDACKPYAFHPCGRHTNQTYYGECPKDHLYRTPKCKPYCQFGYGKRYKSDKVYGQFANYVYGEPNIQREIMTNGPVQAAFAVFEDFVHYKSGIYVVRCFLKMAYS